VARSSVTCLDGEVLRIQDLGPTFRRITFGGPGMADFGIAGPALDMRLKLVIPPAGVGEDERFDLPGLVDRATEPGMSWYKEWLQVPEAERGAMRTYTVRAWRDAERELDVDLVLHTDADGHSGPAAAWAQHAAVGDRLHILGPHREFTGDTGGIEFEPGSSRDLLLAGDETAVPAIVSILGSLPPEATGCALLEVPRAEDVQPVTAPAGLDVRWLVRGDATVGSRLEDAVHEVVRTREATGEDWGHGAATSGTAQDAELEEIDIDTTILWEVPHRLTAAAHASGPAAEGEADDARRFYAWIAGEAGVVKALRRYLVREVGVDRRQVAFMGYWRIGKAEG